MTIIDKVDINDTKVRNRAYAKAYYEANRDKEKAQQKAYRAANVDKIKAYDKAYYEANRDKEKAQQKAYRAANVDKIKVYNKAHYVANADKYKAQQKIYRAANVDKKKAHYVANADKKKAYYLDNLDKIKAYRKANVDKIKAQTKAYKISIRDKNKERYKTDIQYKLSVLLRARFLMALKRNQKTGSAVRDLGCSIGELQTHLESKFQSGMTWDNHGLYGWHIDHIKPLASFDLTDRAQLLLACHYTNLQPLWATDNLSKGDS